MTIDQPHFRSLLHETIDENPFCCRAVLALCHIEFTSAVETLCVTLGKPSILRVNLDFISRHCETEEHVKALIIHEFLHLLLGHTVRFRTMSPALNIALDAVINAMIHRQLGTCYSGMMSGYYAQAGGILRLLRPISDQDSGLIRNLLEKTEHTRADREAFDFYNLHKAVYSGQMVSDDLLDVARQTRSDEIEQLLKDGFVLLGGHVDRPGCPDDLEPDIAERLRQALDSVRGTDIWRHAERFWQPFFQSPTQPFVIPSAWRKATLAILRRLILPDPKALTRYQEPTCFALPVLHAGDRRGYLRSIWNPILPEISWEASRPSRSGTVQIYLDVSGSMNAELQLLVRLLAEFGHAIRKPLWAFSTVVMPAKIIRGRLHTHSTGGTSIAAVLAHIRKTGPKKALIITDGFVESPAGRIIRSCEIEAIIPASGSSVRLGEYGIPVTQLTPVS